MAKIVDYEKDKPILNRELAKLSEYDQRIQQLEAKIRRLEERLRKAGIA